MIIQKIVTRARVLVVRNSIHESSLDRIAMNVLNHRSKHTGTPDDPIVESTHPEFASLISDVARLRLEHANQVRLARRFQLAHDIPRAVLLDIPHDVRNRPNLRICMDDPMKMGRHNDIRQNSESISLLIVLDVANKDFAVPIFSEDGSEIHDRCGHKEGLSRFESKSSTSTHLIPLECLPAGYGLVHDQQGEISPRSPSIPG